MARAAESQPPGAAGPVAGDRAVTTIRDVARAAGVGVGTVSRVLSGGARGAPATRARVEAAMAQLGYRPSATARALSQGRTHTLEVVVPLVTHHVYVEVLRGIETALADTDYAVVIRTVERAAARDRAFAALGQGGRADGVLVVSLAPTPELLERIAAARLPTVLVDAAHPDLPSVSVDHAAATAEAIRFLRDLGHDRIALVDEPGDHFAPAFAAERRRGFRMALGEANLAPRADYEIVTAGGPEGGVEAAAALLALPDPPTAVVVGSDTQAVGLLQEARRRGRHVPRDLSVVGYGDIEMSRHIGLTTVRVPVRELGRRGVEVLLAELAGSTEPAQIRLPTELMVRKTAGPSRGVEASRRRDGGA
ncbi:MAG: LacI family DNA-binding transcriptional regulator [Thermomicrobiales bacterium]|nr:LacI family DNA-binding transcriptional regulator [Thermomicrobiales bacterium]